MTKFIVFGTQRTGTTLLTSYLNSHKSIMCLGEIFDDKYFYHDDKGDVIDNYLWYSEKNKVSFSEYLDDYLLNRKGYDAIGFKMMWDQVCDHEDLLDDLRERDFKVVYIYRRDILKTYVSRIRSLKLN